MKREIAAICAALLFLTSCSANGASTQEMPASLVDNSQTQESTAQADTQDIVTLPSVVEGQKPVVDGEPSEKNASDLPVPETFTDEPYELLMDNGKPLEYQPFEVAQNLTNSKFVKSVGSAGEKYSACDKKTPQPERKAHSGCGEKEK